MAECNSFEVALKSKKPRAREAKRSKFYWVRLPVLGELGRKSVFAPSRDGKIERLHCVLDFVPKSRIFLVHQVIVERVFAEELRKEQLSGFAVRDGIFELNKQAKVLGQRGPLPELAWLEITGQAGVDDLGMQRGTELIVSALVNAMIQRGANEGVIIREGRAPSAAKITKMLFAEARELVEQTRQRLGKRPKSPFIVSSGDLADLVEKVRKGSADADMISTLRRATGRMDIAELIARADPSESSEQIMDRACSEG